MTTPVLGGHTFLETPTVNGVPVLLAGDVASSPIITVLSGSIARQTGTTVIPYDNTAPLITEGTQIWTQTVTPASTASQFQFIFVSDCGASANSRITLSLWRGTTLINVRSVYVTATIQPATLHMLWTDSPATVASTTYTMRIGVTSGTWTLNGTSAATFGASNLAAWSLTEIA